MKEREPIFTNGAWSTLKSTALLGNEVGPTKLTWLAYKDNRVRSKPEEENNQDILLQKDKDPQ